MKKRLSVYNYPITIVFVILVSAVLLLPSTKSASGKDSFNNITPQELQSMRKKDEKFILLDVRSYRERKEGYIPDSLFIPVDEISSRYKELLPYKDEKIIVYCYSGKRSARASGILSHNGFANILNMTGGIRDWQKIGGEITR